MRWVQERTKDGVDMRRDEERRKRMSIGKCVERKKRREGEHRVKRMIGKSEDRLERRG